MQEFEFPTETKGAAESGGFGLIPGVYDCRIAAVELGESSSKNTQWKLGLEAEKAHGEGLSEPGTKQNDWITWSAKGCVRGWLLFQAVGIDPESMGKFDLENTGIVLGKMVRVTVEEDKRDDGKVFSKVAFRGYESATGEPPKQGERPAEASLPASAKNPGGDEDVPF